MNNALNYMPNNRNQAEIYSGARFCATKAWHKNNHLHKFACCGRYGAEIMKWISSLFYVLFLSGCVGHYDKNDFDIELAENSFYELKSALQPNALSIEESVWPSYFREIGAKAIHADKTGVYVELDRFFVDESGLFSPFDISFIAVGGEDPEFIHLSGSIYSYHSKG